MAVSDAAAARAADDLYRAHAGDVYRYALAILGQPADAEDVTQTTFLNAYRSLERGVRPRKPASWLLTIASNVMKQRFRSERALATAAILDDRAGRKVIEDDETPTIGELLAALRAIPPLQRQAIVLREFEGRSYTEIAEILDVTTSALETLLFRARRSLAEELQSQLSCTDAQLALSRAVDGRLRRKERRRLRGHLEECAECARFARVQQRHRRAFRGLALVPVPVSLGLFRGLETPGALAAALPPAAATGAPAAGGILGGAIALKAAAAVTAATVAGGVGVVGATEVEPTNTRTVPVRAEAPAERTGHVAPPAVRSPGRGVDVGSASANGLGRVGAGRRAARSTPPGAMKRASPARSHEGRGAVPTEPRAAARSNTRRGSELRVPPPRADRTPRANARSENGSAPKAERTPPARGRAERGQRPRETVTRERPETGNRPAERERGRP
jgi:RNA polymerase sigma-70 factor, ECF subfamily